MEITTIAAQAIYYWIMQEAHVRGFCIDKDVPREISAKSSRQDLEKAEAFLHAVADGLDGTK